jgi:excinuclease UvrABC nuclease subunit
MPWQGTEKFAFGIFTVLEKCPVNSGVYALFTGEKCIYVGASENIQVRLLHHLNGPHPCVLQYGVTSFAYESVPSEAHAARQEDLIREFNPLYCGLEAGTTQTRHPVSLPA